MSVETLEAEWGFLQVSEEGVTFHIVTLMSQEAWREGEGLALPRRNGQPQEYGSAEEMGHIKLRDTHPVCGGGVCPLAFQTLVTIGCCRSTDSSQ